MRTKRIQFLLAASLILFAGCKPGTKPDSETTVQQTSIEQESPQTEEAPNPTTQSPIQQDSPKKIILFIGDGMGAGAVTAATYANGKLLEMEKMPHFTWMENHEYEFLTTDSAASATAFSSGVKTHFEGLGVKPGTTDETDDDPSTHVRTVLEAAEEHGMKTGLVALSRINHATPGAFAGHRFHRSHYDEIAEDMVKSGVDVLLGAGTKYFDPKVRKDKKDLLKVVKEQGFTIATSAKEVKEQAGKAEKLFGLLYDKDVPYVRENNRKMSLADMTRAAIQVLDRDNDKGWFLMVEGSFIDWCEHDLAGLCTVSETIDFDQAIGVGREYVKNNPDALAIVTADHETAGVSVLQPSIYERYANVLGGMKKAEEAAAAPKKFATKDQKESIPAIIQIGDYHASYAMKPTPTVSAFGLVELPDSRFTVSFGYLSVASRKLENKKNAEDFLASHTTTFVPLFTEGKGSRAVAEIYDNADLGKLLIDFVDKANVPVQPVPPNTTPKNVIFLIGDGMGINSVTAAYYGHGNLAMLTSPIRGIVSTNGTDYVVNDSAATATALSTGYRTRRGALGVIFDSNTKQMNPVETILERAEKTGRRTGLVTTTPLTHATPAAYYAHVPSRSQTSQIADDFLSVKDRIPGSDGIDVAIASGQNDFTGEKEAKLKALGYNYLTSWTKEPLQDKTVLLIGNDGMNSATKRKANGEPSLTDMTNAAIQTLTTQNAADSKGFFLMVEGGQIDWLLHDRNNTTDLIDEIVDFDDAVRAAVDFAKKDGNTLVVVTADHDHTMSIVDNHYAFRKEVTCEAEERCGGKHKMISIPAAKSGIRHMEGFSDTKLTGKYNPPSFEIQYDWLVTTALDKANASAPHSANFVPLFGWGPSSARFESFHHQPNIGKLLFDVTGW